MKAVIMAGGNGTRLYPLTAITNKHLLPLYNRPVIFHIIDKIVSAGIDRIMIVANPHSLNHFVQLLGSGKDFVSQKTGTQIQIIYGIQNAATGIAYGLHIARDYIGTDNLVFFLGDNIVEDDLLTHVENFKGGAKVFLKKVKDPRAFGVAEVDKHSRVICIEEKPDKPKSSLAVTGVYIYDNTVFQKLDGQKLSKRGELEITDLNNKYAQEGTLEAVMLKKPWFDIGTFDALLEASKYMKKKYSK
ncbi:MAG: sugar phosphate nucleotidyltransferase [bacterium]|nr:sugar phosphate nucleotidyltransferase [bacterium]